MWNMLLLHANFTFEITIVGFNGSLSYTGDREGTLEFTNNKATEKLGTGQTKTINNIIPIILFILIPQLYFSIVYIKLTL